MTGHVICFRKTANEMRRKFNSASKKKNDRGKNHRHEKYSRKMIFHWNENLMRLKSTAQHIPMLYASCSSPQKDDNIQKLTTSPYLPLSHILWFLFSMFAACKWLRIPVLFIFLLLALGFVCSSFISPASHIQIHVRIKFE